MRKSVVLVAMLGALVGCAGGTDSGGSTVTTGGLVVEEHGDQVSGHWTRDGVEIQFFARMLTANILDLEIELDGMTSERASARQGARGSDADRARV